MGGHCRTATDRHRCCCPKGKGGQPTWPTPIFGSCCAGTALTCSPLRWGNWLMNWEVTQISKYSVGWEQFAGLLNSCLAQSRYDAERFITIETILTESWREKLCSRAEFKPQGFKFFLCASPSPRLSVKSALVSLCGSFTDPALPAAFLPHTGLYSASPQPCGRCSARSYSGSCRISAVPA